MDIKILNLIEDKYEKLSKTFKLIANFIVKEYSSIPFLSVNELSKKIGVSNASITRFSQELGYSGFPAMQKEIQTIIEREIYHMREFKNSITIEEDDVENILRNTIDLNIKVLQSTYSEELYKTFNSAVELIKNCKKLYLLGSRSSYTVSYYFHYMLTQFMDNVELLSMGSGDTFNKLSYIKNEDLLFSFNFAQCTKFTYMVTEHFKKNGNKIIAMSDNYFSPIAKKADIVFIAKNTTSTYSFVSSMTILNALIIRLGKINKEKTLNRLKQQEKIALENDVYVSF